MTIGIRSNSVVNFEKKNIYFRSNDFFVMCETPFLKDILFQKCQFLLYVCFTGKSENLAEKPLFKGYLQFFSKLSSFSKKC